MRSWRGFADSTISVVACPKRVWSGAYTREADLKKYENKTSAHGSRSDILEALESLSAKELVGLERFARLRSVGLREIDWEDLLHEAIERTLSGSRKWPISVPFPVFLHETIRSLASTHLKSGYFKLSVSTEENSGEDIFADRFDPEAEVSARQSIRKIEALFADDPPALSILRGLSEGLSPAAVQQEAVLTQRQYATAQRRIRRTLDRALRDGKL